MASLLNTKLLQAIGVERLTVYFEQLDELRESGKTNMFGAGSHLRRLYPGMSVDESHAIMAAWFKHDITRPAEDRACDVIEVA